MSRSYCHDISCAGCGAVFRGDLRGDPSRRYCTRQCRGQAQRNAVPFTDRIDRSGGPDACWPWIGATDIEGYGRYSTWCPITKKRSHFRAHCMAFEHHHGTIDKTLLVRHSCDNPPCCNPAHLLQGTHAKNARDRVERGRSANIAGEAHPQARLTWPIVRMIRASTESSHSLGPKLGISFGMVCRIRRGVAWQNDPIEKAS